MAEVTIACPATGRFVSVGLEMKPTEFEKLGPKIFRMRCSACGSEHLWSFATAWLADSPPKPPATSRDDSDLLKSVEAVTKPRFSAGAQTDFPPRERITGILERLLETNETDSAKDPNRKGKK
jgi:hypothetical protein